MGSQVIASEELTQIEVILNELPTIAQQIYFLQANNITIRDIQECVSTAVHHNEKCNKLQSQHKKLVDAIQNRITELTLAKIELHPANNQHLIWTKIIDELQKIIEESKCN